MSEHADETDIPAPPAQWAFAIDFHRARHFRAEFQQRLNAYQRADAAASADRDRESTIVTYFQLWIVWTWLLIERWRASQRATHLGAGGWVSDAHVDQLCALPEAEDAHRLRNALFHPSLTSDPRFESVMSQHERMGRWADEFAAALRTALARAGEAEPEAATARSAPQRRRQ